MTKVAKIVLKVVWIVFQLVFGFFAVVLSWCLLGCIFNAAKNFQEDQEDEDQNLSARQWLRSTDVLKKVSDMAVEEAYSGWEWIIEE